jgi:rhodanese-related sulfurtransferase
VRQAAENGLCGAQPIVTICETGPRAAIAASVLQSVGLDARPALGGVAAWRARGGQTCSFRRCGGS